MMKKQNLLATMNAIALMVTLFVNYLANALPLNNRTTGEISNQFAVLFKPAGYAFSIWGLIYISLILFFIYQLIHVRKKTEIIDKIGPWFILSCLVNTAWLFAWHSELFTLTVLLMLVLLGSLIKIYINLKTNTGNISRQEHWFVHQPFSLYLGWISVATVANITIYLKWLDWGGFGLSETFWFILVCLLGLSLSSYIALSRRDYIFNLVFLWAFIAIGVNNAGIPEVNTISWIYSSLAFLPVVLGVIKSRKETAS